MVWVHLRITQSKYVRLWWDVCASHLKWYIGFSAGRRGRAQLPDGVTVNSTRLYSIWVIPTSPCLHPLLASNGATEDLFYFLFFDLLFFPARMGWWCLPLDCCTVVAYPSVKYLTLGGYRMHTGRQNWVSIQGFPCPIVSLPAGRRHEISLNYTQPVGSRTSSWQQ